MSQPNITLYTDSTPNGIKISIALEELGIPYKVEHVNISTNRQKEDWFLEINPNGRIPALTDTFSDGQSIRLFEGGSILEYLAEQYDKDHKISFPAGSRESYEMRNWVYWQHGGTYYLCSLCQSFVWSMITGLGPMQGQANHFFRYAPEKIKYGIDRYINESRRLYRVLDTHLAKSKSGFIVGDHVSTTFSRCFRWWGSSIPQVSLADLTTYGWVYWAGWAGVDIEEFPHVKAWEEKMTARPAVDKGKDIPKKLTVKEKLKDPKHAEEEAKKASAWIQQGMKGDAAQKWVG
jgi:glutathione S-transferase